MKQLLEDILYTLNQLPNRKVTGKEWTTYDLAKRVEQELQEIKLDEEFEQQFSSLYTDLMNKIV